MMIFLFMLLPLAGLCGKVINNHSYFLPNHQDCGLRSVNSSDPRTLNPWNAAVYTRQSSDSAWEYLVTGAVISTTAVVTIFQGGFGQRPPGGAEGQKYNLPSPENVMVVAGLSTTDLLQADSNAAYASVKYIAPCRSSKEPDFQDYHVVIIRLLTPFNISTPFVRPICVPFFAKFAFEKWVVETEQLGMMSGFYSAHPTGFLSNNTGPHYASIFAPAKAYGETRCRNYAKFHKAHYPQHQFCGTLLPDGIENDTCLTHGTAGVWESTQAVINFEPSFGPSPRFFLFSILFLVPEQDGGFCGASSPFISSSLIGVYDYIRGHLVCPSDTFPCTSERRCIQLSSVCDSIQDCANGEDEDPAFCWVTFVCDVDSEYQCGLYGKCIERNRTLDGIEDCPLGKDENPYFYMASSGQEDDQTQTECEPIEGFLNQLLEGQVATCTDALGQPTNCTDAVAGTDVTLTCGPRYSPAGRTTSVWVSCGLHGIWDTDRPFSCEPKCGLLSNECLPSENCTANGKEDENPGGFPWRALIFRANAATHQLDYICAGSLIERNIILTSARCTVDAQGDPVEPKDLRIVLNGSSADYEEYRLSSDIEIFWVEQIWRPSSFDFQTLKSDIAIIHLERPTYFKGNIRPICYSRGKLRRPPAQNVSSSGILTGFSLTKNGKVSSGLKHFELNVTKNEHCGFSKDSPDKFCAQVLEGDDANLCHGDSAGAGIFFPAKDKQSGAYVIKGVVSSEETGAKGCGKGAGATSFTDVDSYTEWILSVIEGIDTNPNS